MLYVRHLYNSIQTIAIFLFWWIWGFLAHTFIESFGTKPYTGHSSPDWIICILNTWSWWKLFNILGRSWNYNWFWYNFNNNKYFWVNLSIIIDSFFYLLLAYYRRINSLFILLLILKWTWYSKLWLQVLWRYSNGRLRWGKF